MTLYARQPSSARDRTPLAGLIEEWLAGSLRPALRQLRQYRYVVTRFCWQARIRLPDQISPNLVRQYLGKLRFQGRAPATISNHASAIRLFCKWLQADGYIAGNPCQLIQCRARERKPPRWLDIAEVETALRLARQHGCWPEVALALATGLRVSEMARLAWGDIDVDRRTLMVRKSKSGRFRVVPLSGLALQALAEQRGVSGHLGTIFPARRTCRGRSWLIDEARSSRIWQRVFQPVRQASPKFDALPGRSTGRSWHLLRHTAASRWVQAGVSLYKVAAWLGHRSIQTTQVYAHLAEGYDPEVERGQKGEVR